MTCTLSHLLQTNKSMIAAAASDAAPVSDADYAFQMLHAQKQHMANPGFDYCDSTGRKEALSCIVNNETVFAFQSCRTIDGEEESKFAFFEVSRNRGNGQTGPMCVPQLTMCDPRTSRRLCRGP